MVFLIAAHIVISVALIGVILLQNQGGGISASFGGAGEFYRGRRSLEKLMLYVTIFLGIAFGAMSLILLYPL